MANDRGSLAVRILSLFEGVTIALDSLRQNRVRAALTILGVAVGVFVVVVISAAIHGINASVAKDFEKAGPTTFTLNRFPITFEACDGTEDTCKWRRNPRLNFSDAKALGTLSTVRAASAQMNLQRAVRYKDRDLPSTTVIGAMANWTIVDHAGDLYPGRSFTESEETNGERVAIINDEMAKRLFAESDPLDKMISIGNVPFKVIGVYHYEASFLTGGNRPRAIVPFETAYRSLHASWNNVAISVVPRETATRDEVQDEVIAMMRARHALRPSQDNNFAIITQDKLFETYNKIFGMFFLVMIVLSAIGLLVGGVGVIAIMMISVTERTREIGIRLAIGAFGSEVMLQFLLEAIVLSTLGGIIGICLGLVGSYFAANALALPFVLAPDIVALAFVFSALVGVVFGYLPARKAANLDPIEALRHE